MCAIYVYGGDATTFHAQAVTRDPYHKCDNPIAAQVKFQGGWVPGTDYSGWVYHHAIAVARSPTGATMACRGYHHAHHKGNENHDIYDVHNVHQHHSGQC